MGMFDYIRCKYPLPPEFQDTVFQTKSLECALLFYEISEAGQLRCFGYADPDEERPVDPKRVVPWLVPWPERDEDFTGVVVFYDDRSVAEFMAVFENGKLVWSPVNRAESATYRR
jgi:hypothetical protein